jgi:hypothetical protein
MPTTVPLIRAQIISVLEAATPTRLASHKFRRSDKRTPFSEWATKNSGKLRSFDVFQLSAGIELAHLHPTQVMRDEPFTIAIAYPRLTGIAGANDLDSLRDMQREDARVVRDTVFKSSNYLSGVCLMGPPVASFSEDGEVWLTVFDFAVTFYEAQTL